MCFNNTENYFSCCVNEIPGYVHRTRYSIMKLSEANKYPRKSEITDVKEVNL